MATKKRGQNEGTIFQRADGKWVSRISLGYDTVKGTRRQKAFYGNTKEEVRKKLTEALRGNDLGVNIAPAKQTVATFLNTWLETVAKPRIRIKTYRSYEQIIRNHLILGLGRYELQKLNPPQVQAFLNAKAETGLSTEHLRRVLRTALTQAVKWDYLQRNVATLVSAPKQKKHEFAYLDEDQARTFIKAVEGHNLEALFTVALAIGLRLSEALGLKWSDVDLEAGSIRVRAQLQRSKGKIEFVEPKTEKAKRTISLPKFAIETLKRHKGRQAEIRLLNADVWQDYNLVFTSSVGTPAEERNIRRTLDSVMARAKLPRLRFHDLRHSCATLLLSQGVDVRTIMEILGHSQIALTLNTYSHVVQSLQKEAATKMDAMLGAG
ncbi:MAG: site-specific integrase [Fimbriimonadaceae bacterium]